MLVGVDGDQAKMKKAGDILGTSSQVLSTIIGVVANMQDAKKRKEFAQALEYLSNDQQKYLEAQLRDARSEVERIKILSDAVARIQVQKIYGASDEVLMAERKNRMNAILYVAGITLIGGVVVYLIVKNA